MVERTAWDIAAVDYKTAFFSFGSGTYRYNGGTSFSQLYTTGANVLA